MPDNAAFQAAKNAQQASQLEMSAHALRWPQIKQVWKRRFIDGARTPRQKNGRRLTTRWGHEIAANRHPYFGKLRCVGMRTHAHRKLLYEKGTSEVRCARTWKGSLNVLAESTFGS
jgi:hypothetical protein